MPPLGKVPGTVPGTNDRWQLWSDHVQVVGVYEHLWFSPGAQSNCELWFRGVWGKEKEKKKKATFLPFPWLEPSVVPGPLGVT